MLLALTAAAEAASAQEAPLPAELEGASPAPAICAPACGLAPGEALRVDVRPESGRAVLAVTERWGALRLRRVWSPGAPGGWFGAGWRSELESRLVPLDDQAVAVLRPDGASVFAPVAEGLWASLWGELELLRQRDDGWELLTDEARLLRFDAGGRLTRAEPGFAVTRGPGAALSVVGDDGARWELRCEPSGRLLSASGPAGEVVRYRYDDAGALRASEAEPAQRYAWAQGLLARVEEEGGPTLELAWEGARVRSLRAGDWRQDYAYPQGEVGLTVATPAGRWSYRAQPDGWRVSSPLGQEEVAIDPRGRLRRPPPRAGPLRRERDGARWLGAWPGGPVERERDAAGRLLGLRGPQGASARLARDEDGRVSSWSGVDLRPTRYGWDAAGRLLAAEGPAGRTRLAWSEAGQLLALETPAGRRWRFAWQGGLLRDEDGPQGRVRWEHDARGLPRSRLDATGRRTELRLDPIGRPREVRQGESLQRFHYDARGRLVGGELDGEGVLRRLDDAGRPLAERSAAAELRYRQSEGAEEVVTPWGLLRRRLDAQGRVTRLDSPAGSFRFDYDAFGQRVGLGYPGGVEVRLERDGLGRLTAQTVRDAAGRELLRARWGRDARHQLRWRQVGDRLERFDYDAAGRLCRSEGPDRRWSTRYDGDGHRLEEERGGAPLACSYDAQGRLLTRGQETFASDACGRLVERRHAGGVDRFGWDALGRLARVERAGRPRVDYRYDGLGRLALRRVGGEETRFVYEGTRLLAELGPGARVRRWVYGPDLDEPLAWEEGGRWTFLILDDLHGALAALGPDGALRPLPSLSPWGEPLTPPAGDPSLVFAGRRYDPEAGLYVMRARPYDPLLGRFLSPDPAGLEGGLNAYAYAAGRPLERLDPLGLWDWVPDWSRRVSAWSSQELAPAFTSAGEFLRGYGAWVAEDVASGRARDRALGAVDAYATFVTCGLLDPRLRRWADDPGEAARGQVFGEAAGWAFALVSGRELLQLGARGLWQGLRALPGAARSVGPRSRLLLSELRARAPAALRALPGRGVGWARELPGRLRALASQGWAERGPLGRKLAAFLLAQGAAAWSVTGGPFVSLGEAVARHSHRLGSAALRAGRARAGTLPAGAKGSAGLTPPPESALTASRGGAVKPAAEAPAPTDAPAPGSVGEAGAPGETVGLRGALAGERGARAGTPGSARPGARPRAPPLLPSVHPAPPAWLAARFEGVVETSRAGKTGPAARPEEVADFLHETWEHVREVTALVKAMGGKVRPVPLEVAPGDLLRGVHDFGERASVRRVEELIASLRRDPVMKDGVPLEVPAWLAELPRAARAAGETTIDVGKLSPHVAAGLGRAGPPDPFAIRLHNLSPHHWRDLPGEGSALIEAIADKVNAMRQVRIYRPQPLPFARIRAILLDDVAEGRLPDSARPLIERALVAQSELERSGAVNPYYALDPATAGSR